MFNLFFVPGCVFEVLKTGRLIEVPGFLGQISSRPHTSFGPPERSKLEGKSPAISGKSAGPGEMLSFGQIISANG